MSAAILRGQRTIGASVEPAVRLNRECNENLAGDGFGRRAQSQSQSQPKPANFPSVDGETQKQRDAGRRKILEQELAQEQQQLDVAKKQLATQQDVRLGSEANYARVAERLRPFEDRVRLHETNIDSLKKELGNIK